MTTPRVALGCLVLTAALTGCSETVAGHPTIGPADAERTLIRDYIDELNTTAREGTGAQQDFLDETTHPDVSWARCRLSDVTVEVDPTWTTLEPDADWSADGEDPPAGSIYSIAVTATALLGDSALANSVGIMHVVVLDDTAYGFPPCPS